MEYYLSNMIGDNFRTKIVEDIENLFDKHEGVGYQQEDQNLMGS